MFGKQLQWWCIIGKKIFKLAKKKKILLVYAWVIIEKNVCLWYSNHYANNNFGQIGHCCMGYLHCSINISVIKIWRGWCQVWLRKTTEKKHYSTVGKCQDLFTWRIVFLVQNIAMWKGFFVASLTHLSKCVVAESEIPYPYLQKIPKNAEYAKTPSFFFFFISPFPFLFLDVEPIIRISLCECLSYFLNQCGNAYVSCALPFFLSCRL